MAEEHIKINPVPTKVKYSGNGVVKEFPTGFAFFEDDNIVVYHNGVIINTGYSVTGVGETDGGVVTFDVAPAEGDKIVIIRKVAIERVTDFQEGGAFRAKNINDELDRQTAFCQQIQEEIDRCVKVEVTDDQSPEELLAEVYGKLDSATAVATDAILAAEQATIAAEKATTAVEAAEKQITETQEYVDEAKLSIDDAIRQATDDVKDAAVQAAEGVIADVESDLRTGLQPLVTEAGDYANLSRTWATGSDDEVQVIEPDEHSSRTYANFSMALANAPEDVPVLESTLLATDVVKGPKGDSGTGEFSGDIQFEGSFNVHGDDNHPVKVTSLAGASASGYQVVDSNGAGESDFEHAATGDRYITRIANKSTVTGKTVNVDLYQTTAGKSVLDLSKPDTILAPQLLDIIFPIGSYYLSEEDSCPLADWMDGCQWEKVGTSLVSGTEAAVVGNGMTLGLTNGTYEKGMVYGYYDSSYYGMVPNANTLGKSVGTSGNTQTEGLATSWGITTDPEKSGIVANLPTITVNIFRRTM